MSNQRLLDLGRGRCWREAHAPANQQVSGRRRACGGRPGGGACLRVGTVGAAKSEAG